MTEIIEETEKFFLNIQHAATLTDAIEKLKEFHHAGAGFDALIAECRNGKLPSEYDRNVVAAVISEVDEFWQLSDYGILDALDLSLTIAHAAQMPLNVLATVLAEANIPLTAKDKKKGREAYVSRLLGNYHKPKFREVCRRLNTHFEADTADRIRDWNRSDIDNLMFVSFLAKDISNVERALWTAGRILQQPLLTKEIKEFRLLDFLVVSAKAWMLANSTGLSEMLQGQQSPVSIKHHKVPNSKQQLEELLAQKSQQAEELKSELEVLYEQAKIDADNLNAQLKAAEARHIDEMAQLATQFDTERQALYAYIRELEEELRTRPATTAAEVPAIDLNGKTITLVGGHWDTGYREIVEKFGGEFHFVHSEKARYQTETAVKKSDIILIMPGILSHHETFRARDLAKAYGRQFIILKHWGLPSFERRLIEVLGTQTAAQAN